MIRIDEIYCNTFLPILQDRPWHGIHWFDPFGSVKFEHLRSVPAVPWHHDAVRYLFWDQEPLHQHTVDQTLSQYKAMYNGQHHIVTSEHDSDMVRYVTDTYGFIPHYYFFHGWAALDWFRGYHRSFLMLPPRQRSITQTFLSPNRIVAGLRQHRLIMFYHMIKKDLLHNHISFPAVCPGENIPVIQALTTLTSMYPDMVDVFSHSDLPMNFTGEQGHPMNSMKLDLYGPAAQSLLYVVTETVASGRRQHLTEKSFKPICLRMPFVIAGTAGSLAYLRSYGFRTFGEVWDESYDQEINDHTRLAKIAELLQSLDRLDVAQKQKLFDSTVPIIQHNFEHFYGGGFEKLLWDELQGMIHEF